jgi:hypothetical protein
MSWRQFCSASGLPQIALEQLLAGGLLRAKDDPAVSELFGERQLESSSAESFLVLRWDRSLEGKEFNWVAATSMTPRRASGTQARK